MQFFLYNYKNRVSVSFSLQVSGSVYRLWTRPGRLLGTTGKNEICSRWFDAIYCSFGPWAELE